MNFLKYAQKGEEFLNKVANELGCSDDKNKAGRILRSTLHVFRDQSTPQESMQLISQLPMMLKAIYVDGWNIGKQKNKVRHLDDFLERVMEVDGNSADDDFPSYEKTLSAVNSVFRVIKTYVSEGEIEDLRRTLPEELRPLLD